MSLALAWIVFPVVLAALSFGCGLLVEWASGLRLPGTLIVAVGLCASRRCRQPRHRDGPHSVACRAARHCARGRRSGPRSPTPVAPSRRMGAQCGGRSLRGLRGADRPVRHGDVRRLHHARRHQHVACAHGQGDGERANAVRVGSVDLRARAQGLLRQRLSRRCVHAARCGRCADGRGHRLALPADDRLLRRNPGAVDLFAHVCARLFASPYGLSQRSSALNPPSCSPMRSGAGSKRSRPLRSSHSSSRSSRQRSSVGRVGGHCFPLQSPWHRYLRS